MKLKFLFVFFPAILGFQSAVFSEEAIKITGTLARPVKLYMTDDANSNVIGTWEANANFENDPKPVKKIHDSFVQIEHDGKLAWVMIRAVRANRQIRMPEDCGSTPIDNVPRAAATRGVGERCKKAAQ